MTTRMAIAGLIGLTIVCAAQAEPGNGIHYGPWTISPYAELIGTYDSNINQSRTDKKDEFFADSTLGLRFGYSSYKIECDGLGFLSYRNYADLSDGNFGSGGELLRFKYGNRDQVVVEVNQTLRRIEDLDRYGNAVAIGGVSPDSILDISSRSRRDINQAGLSAGKNISDKLSLDAGYRFDSVNYDNESLFDMRNHICQAEAAYKVTEKTAGLLTVQGAIQENISLNTDAKYYAARLGLKTLESDKVTLRGGAGVQYYDQAEGDANSSFSFELTSSWIATDKIVIQAGGRNGSQLTSLYADNATDYQAYWLGGTYKITPTLSTSLSGGYRIDDYINPVVNGDSGICNRQDKGIGARIRADYQAPAKFLKVFTEASYESTTSSMVDDYSDTRVALGVTLTY